MIYDEADMSQWANALRALAESANPRGLYLEAGYQNEIRELVREFLS